MQMNLKIQSTGRWIDESKIPSDHLAYAHII